MAGFISRRRGNEDTVVLLAELIHEGSQQILIWICIDRAVLEKAIVEKPKEKVQVTEF